MLSQLPNILRGNILLIIFLNTLIYIQLAVSDDFIQGIIRPYFEATSSISTCDAITISHGELKRGTPFKLKSTKVMNMS